MKLMTILESFLEGNRAPLYHFTEVYSALSIVKLNTIASEIDYQDRAKMIGPILKSGRISLTRDKSVRVRGKNSAVGFMLDGEKIRNNFKVYPYADHFVLINKKHPGDYRAEAEEYVDGLIKPLDKYLMKIFISNESYDELRDGVESFENHLKMAHLGSTRKSIEHNPNKQRLSPEQLKLRQNSYKENIAKYNGLLKHPKLVVGEP